MRESFLAGFYGGNYDAVVTVAQKTESSSAYFILDDEMYELLKEINTMEDTEY